jgi:hypothetical protein
MLINVSSCSIGFDILEVSEGFSDMYCFSDTFMLKKLLCTWQVWKRK